MHSTEQMKSDLLEAFPDAEVNIDRPATDNGSWFLDATLYGHQVIVEWHAELGFGVTSTTDPGLGEGPDEICKDAAAALARVKELLRERTRTIPVYFEGLGQLREALGVTQVELAKRLGVQQSAISKLERRPDLHVSTLRNVITAMGGRLEIRAVFDNGIRTIHFESESEVELAHIG